MPAGSALPSLFFTFAGMVMLVIVSASTPTWDAISFLDVTRSDQAGTTHYGIFGPSLSSSTHVGYRIPDVDTRVLHALSYSLVMIPIGAAFATLAFLFGLCGAARQRAGTVLMTAMSVLAFVEALSAWVVSMVFFGIARKRFNDNELYNAKWGNGEWILLGAVVSLSLAFCSGVVGSFARHKRDSTATF